MEPHNVQYFTTQFDIREGGAPHRRVDARQGGSDHAQHSQARQAYGAGDWLRIEGLDARNM